MKKYIFIIIALFLLTACNKEYQMTCSGIAKDENGTDYELNVTIHYNIDDKVKALDYKMVYYDEDSFNKSCIDSKDKNPKCENLTVSFEESDEITTSFTKKDIINMLEVIGANECK